MKISQQSTFPRWITYTIIGIIITLVISAILNILTPKEQIAPTPLTNTNYDQTSSEFSNLTYTGPTIETPINLNIAQTTITNYEQELKLKLIKEFNLKQIQDFDVWTNDDWALTIEKNKSRFIISSQIFTQSLNKFIALNETTIVAQKFLNSYLPQDQVIPLANQAEYFEDQFGEPAKTAAGKAKIIKVVFGYSIDNYPVFYKDNIDNFIEIYVDSNKNIARHLSLPMISL